MGGMGTNPIEVFFCIKNEFDVCYYYISVISLMRAINISIRTPGGPIYLTASVNKYGETCSSVIHVVSITFDDGSTITKSVNSFGVVKICKKYGYEVPDYINNDIHRKSFFKKMLYYLVN